MKTRLLNWARSLPLQRLLWVSALSAWVLDLISALYFVRYWEVKNTGAQMWSMAMAMQGLDWYALEPEYRQQLISILTMSAGMMLLGILIVNTVFYFYLAHHKRWSWQYVVTYCIGAAGMGLITMFEGVRVGIFWDIFNALSIPAYVFLGFVVWARKPDCADKGFRFKRAQSPG